MTGVQTCALPIFPQYNLESNEWTEREFLTKRDFLSFVEGKTIYIYDDFASAEVNTEQFWECIEDKTKGCGYINTERDADKVSQIRRLGANTQPARKGSKSVSTGLQWLKSNKIVVDSRCKAIIANLELYSWKKNAQGEYIEIPEDVNNDSIDALRYAMSYDIMGKIKMIKSSLSVY